MIKHTKDSKVACSLKMASLEVEICLGKHKMKALPFRVCYTKSKCMQTTIWQILHIKDLNYKDVLANIKSHTEENIEAEMRKWQSSDR